MQKIISLFKRDYEGTHLVYDEIVPGAEWVIDGVGVATVKYDGTCCMVREGKLYKRRDRKLTKAARKRHFDRAGRRTSEGPIPIDCFKPAVPNWEPAEPAPNLHTGHWPGWIAVGDGPEDKWHQEAWADYHNDINDGTYELIGPKVQGNPYGLRWHTLRRHGNMEISRFPRTFAEIKEWLAYAGIEGVVWHHPDGRMVKIKRRDFGLPWPA